MKSRMGLRPLSLISLADLHLERCRLEKRSHTGSSTAGSSTAMSSTGQAKRYLRRCGHRHRERLAPLLRDPQSMMGQAFAGAELG